MQPPISKATKSAIIQGYLKGEGRDLIATNVGVGGGTVTKTINEWKHGLDFPEAEELRELAVQIRKLGVPASRYAEGARLASILINLGVGDEQFRDFVSRLYTKCQKTGFKPEQVGSLLDQLSGLPESVPMQQIPEHIRELTDQIERKKLEIQQIESERLEAEKRRDNALSEEKITYENVKAFATFRAGMKNNFSMVDLPRYVPTLAAIKQFGFDPEFIISKLSNLQKAETDSEAYEMRAKFLEEECKRLEAQRLAHIHSLSIYNDLEMMRMGIKELKLQWHTVREIAAANNIPQDRANQKLFEDLQTQYDYKLGFETTIQNLKAEIQQNQQVNVQNSTMMVFLNSIILEQFNQIQNVSGLVVFGPLVKAAKGETVPPNQLKSALIGVIDMLLGKVDPTDSSIEALKSSRLLLQQSDSGDIA